ncbi:MAG: DegQ family serine endoprotease [Arenimonas sp.]
MKPVSRFVLGFSTCALLVACFSQVQQPVQASAAATFAGQATSNNAALPLVNLPDFSVLVERTGPAVVNIEASVKQPSGKNASAGPSGMPPGEEEIPEIFKRFFGQPGMPMPQQPRGGTSFGSGFIISSDGYILTNHHVIADTDEVLVRLADRREFKAKVVGSDEMSDVALLKVEATNLPVLQIADSGKVKPGQWVIAIGSPFGFDHSVTAGIVSGLGRPSIDGSQRYVPFIQTDVAINRGNSGGPLLNTAGEVVGINSQIFSNSGGYMGVSFAIPMEVAMNAVKQLKQTGKVTRGQLGVQIRDVTRDEVRELGLPRPGGAFVNGVVNGSPAQKAGILPGDVITALNGSEIVQSSMLPPMVGALPPGMKVNVDLLRDGKQKSVTVQLTALDETAAQAIPGGNPRPDAAGPNALGIAVAPVDAKTRAQLGLAEGEGVQITRVLNPLAAQAGLSAGDVVLQVGRQSVHSVSEFNAVLKAFKSGDRVRLLVRDSQSTGLVTLEMP